jgi:hypothetical protein
MSRKYKIDQEFNSLDRAIDMCNDIECDLQAEITQISSLNTRYALSYPYADSKFAKEMKNLATSLAQQKQDLDENSPSSSSSNSSLASWISCTSLNRQTDNLELSRLKIHSIFVYTWPNSLFWTTEQRRRYWPHSADWIPKRSKSEEKLKSP